MILLCDTRQHKSKHDNIERYCSEHSIVMIPCCLKVGDYMFPNGTIAVDTKQSLDELAKDLYSDSKALNKKYSKCYNSKIKLYVLIEEDIKTMSQLLSWSSKRTKITGKMLVNMMHNLKVSYDIRFLFCKKQDTGAMIIDILLGKYERGNK